MAFNRMNKWLGSSWQSALGGSWNCPHLFKATLKTIGFAWPGSYAIMSGSGCCAEGASSGLRKVRFRGIAPIPNIKTREVSLWFPSFLIIFQGLSIKVIQGGIMFSRQASQIVFSTLKLWLPAFGTISNLEWEGSCPWSLCQISCEFWPFGILPLD